MSKSTIKLDARIDLKNKFNYSISLDDYRIGGMKWNDVDNGRNFEFSVNKQDILDALHINQTQKVIECLKEIFDLYEPYENDEGDVILTHNGVSFIEYIDNKIKELEGNDENDS